MFGYGGITTPTNISSILRPLVICIALRKQSVFKAGTLLNVSWFHVTFPSNKLRFHLERNSSRLPLALYSESTTHDEACSRPHILFKVTFSWRKVNDKQNSKYLHSHFSTHFSIQGIYCCDGQPGKRKRTATSATPPLPYVNTGRTPRAPRQDRICFKSVQTTMFNNISKTCSPTARLFVIVVYGVFLHSSAVQEAGASAEARWESNNTLRHITGHKLVHIITKTANTTQQTN